MTGYFLAGSRFVGSRRMPWISVLPSRPFATKRTGAFLRRPARHGDETARVGRPEDAVGHSILRAAVLGERKGLIGFAVVDEQVVHLDPGLPLPVQRTTRGAGFPIAFLLFRGWGRAGQRIGIGNGFPLARRAVDPDELLLAVRQLVAVPEALPVREPVRLELGSEELVAHPFAELLRAFVILAGALCEC